MINKWHRGMAQAARNTYKYRGMGLITPARQRDIRHLKIELLEPRCVLASATNLGSIDIPTNDSPTVFIASDFNGDLIPDIAVDGHNREEVDIYLGSSGAAFNFSATHPVGGSPEVLLSGNFNSDGVRDLASANWDSISILLNHSGTFESHRTITLVSPLFDAVAADLNADGNTDLAVLHRFPKLGVVEILLGQGGGVFGDGGVFVPVSAFPHLLEAGDFNGDGRADLAVGPFLDPVNALILLSTTQGFLQYQPRSLGLIPSHFVVADLNSDGRDDLVAADALSDDVAVLLGTDNGISTTPIRTSLPKLPDVFDPNTGTPTDGDPDYDVDLDLVAADFNGDEIIDLAVAGSSGFIFCYPGNRDGTFNIPRALKLTNPANELAIGEFTGDDQSDLLVSGFGNPFLSLLPGQPNGSFGGSIESGYLEAVLARRPDGLGRVVVVPPLPSELAGLFDPRVDSNRPGLSAHIPLREPDQNSVIVLDDISKLSAGLTFAAASTSHRTLTVTFLELRGTDLATVATLFPSEINNQSERLGSRKFAGRVVTRIAKGSSPENATRFKGEGQPDPLSIFLFPLEEELNQLFDESHSENENLSSLNDGSSLSGVLVTEFEEVRIPETNSRTRVREVAKSAPENRHMPTAPAFVGEAPPKAQDARGAGAPR